MHFYPAATAAAAIARHRDGMVQTSAPPAGPLNAIRWEASVYVLPGRGRTDRPESDPGGLLAGAQRAFGDVLQDDSGITVQIVGAGTKPMVRAQFVKVQVLGPAQPWASPPADLKAALRADPARALAATVQPQLAAALARELELDPVLDERVSVDAFPLRLEA
jgi:hypothetical protein